MTEDGEFQPLFAGASQPGAQQPGSPQRGGNPGGGRVGQPPPPSFSSGRSTGGFSQGTPGQVTGPGGLLGVASKSKETSIRIYRGATRYNEWLFRYAGLQNQPGGAPGQQRPGMPQIGPGQPVPPGGRRGGRGPGGFGPGGFGAPGGRGPGRGMRPPG
jgi:translation initiation factor IF-2